MERLSKFALVQKSHEVTEDDLQLIAKYCLVDSLDKDKLFTFRVVLCHNDIDRDYEAFSTEALNKLAEFFVGKTGIKDHSLRADTQLARIFKAEVVVDESRQTAYGEPYAELVGTAYMVRLASNADLITEIEMGIKKEVSVSCALAKAVCSVCGKNLRTERCGHILGKAYEGQKCFAKLEEPVDAYEFSFVAVPAQIGAGTTKNQDVTFRAEYPAATEVAENKKSMLDTLMRAMSLRED